MISVGLIEQTVFVRIQQGLPAHWYYLDTSLVYAHSRWDDIYFRLIKDGVWVHTHTHTYIYIYCHFFIHKDDLNDYLNCNSFLTKLPVSVHTMLEEYGVIRYPHMNTKLWIIFTGKSIHYDRGNLHAGTMIHFIFDTCALNQRNWHAFL